MLTHAQIWKALDALAASNGYSPSGLARHAGLDPTSFNKSKRIGPDGKPRWPSTESISKVLGVTNTSISEFLAVIDEPDRPPLDRSAAAKTTARILLDTKSVLFNAREPFTLKSGRQSPVYLDCRRPISFVKDRKILIDMATLLIRDEIGTDAIDYVAGGETAGIPYGAFLADRLDKPMLYVRKQPKGYGRMAQIEGHLIKGRRVQNILLVEDMMTDGGSKAVFVEALRKAGACVDHIFVLFQYGIFAQTPETMKKMGVTVHALATWWDVLDAAKEQGSFDSETLKSVEAFLNDPENWSPPEG